MPIQQKLCLSVSVHSTIVLPLMFVHSLFVFKLSSYLSAAESVETRQEDMRRHLHSEVNYMIEPQFNDIEEWTWKGLPSVFSSDVFKRIVVHLEADETYVRGAGDKDAWKDGGLHSKDVPKDDAVVQAAKAEWLNGLVEKVRCTLYVISDYDHIS